MREQETKSIGKIYAKTLIGIAVVIMISALSHIAAAQTPKIAFASSRDGNQEIYLMNPDGSNQTRLTNNPAVDSNPSFSPDGSKIAFQSRRDGNLEIYVMNSDGSNPMRLTTDPTSDAYPSFSPDGSKIVFSSNRNGLSDIYVMSVDGSNQTQLTNFPLADENPSFSPDGSKIIFTSYRDNNYEIYVMNANGSNQTNLTNNPADDLFPSFSPDGLKIAFVSRRDNPTRLEGEIYVMNPDGSNQTRRTNNPADDAYPTFSRDSLRIAFMSFRDNNWEIYSMNPDGSNQTNLTIHPADDFYPAWGVVPILNDTTPPIITPNIVGTLGNNGWYRSDVTLTWTVYDNESLITNQTNCGSQTVNQDTNEVPFTCTATSAGGTNSQTVTIKRDTTPPNITFNSRTPPPNASGWHNTSVLLQWDCSDALSGALNPSLNQILFNEGANQNATEGCIDLAGNSATNTQSGINIDLTNPGLAPTVSPNPVVVNNPATATPNAADTLSGIAAQSCDPVDTSVIGNFTVNCTATDVAGRTATATANYQVIDNTFNFSGFFNPIKNPPTVNTIRAGRTIQIKFSLGGDFGLNIFAPGFPASGTVPCNNFGQPAVLQPTVAQGPGLTFDPATNQYQYHWRTDNAWAGTCRQLQVRLTDGTTHVANFQFR